MAPPPSLTLTGLLKEAATIEGNTVLTHAALDTTIDAAAARLSIAAGGLTFSGVIALEVVVLAQAVIRAGGVPALMVVDRDVTQGQLESCLSDTGDDDDAAGPLRLKLNLAVLLPLVVPLPPPLSGDDSPRRLLLCLASGGSVAIPLAAEVARRRQVPVIVGAGPTGLAVAAALREQGIPSIVLERGACIAALWRKPSYSMLKLPLHKNTYELPFMPLPDGYPEHITFPQYADYLETYAANFGIEPSFNTSVLSASYSPVTGLWRVHAEVGGGGVVEYTSRWLVVATGQHAGDRVLPRIPGLAGLIKSRKAVHVSDCYDEEEAYHQYEGKRVLVVGLGNSALQAAHHLWEHGARPTLAPRSAAEEVQAPPRDDPIREMDMVLEDWVPSWPPADEDTRLLARVVLGELGALGLRDLRRNLGLGIAFTGRTTSAVLPYGVAGLIRDGRVRVVRAVDRFDGDHARLVDGSVVRADAVVLATGFRSALPEAKWHPAGPTTTGGGSGSPYRWDGLGCGLYAVGFSKRGFAGDTGAPHAVSVAVDIASAASMSQGRAAARVRVIFASYPRNAGPNGA